MRKLLFCCFLLIVLVSANTSQASYDYSTGRWLQRDPLGVNPSGRDENPFKVLRQYKDGLNVYSYLKSNPIKSADSNGLAKAKIDCGVIVMVKEPEIDFPTINVGHAWIEHPGGSMGFYPEEPAIIFSFVKEK